MNELELWIRLGEIVLGVLLVVIVFVTRARSQNFDEGDGCFGLVLVIIALILVANGVFGLDFTDVPR